MGSWTCLAWYVGRSAGRSHRWMAGIHTKRCRGWHRNSKHHTSNRTLLGAPLVLCNTRFPGEPSASHSGQCAPQKCRSQSPSLCCPPRTSYCYILTTDSRVLGPCALCASHGSRRQLREFAWWSQQPASLWRHPDWWSNRTAHLPRSILWRGRNDPNPSSTPVAALCSGVSTVDDFKIIKNAYQLSKDFILLVLVDPLLLLDGTLLNLLDGPNLICAEVDGLGDLPEASLPDYFYRLEMLHQVLISLVPLDESFFIRDRLACHRCMYRRFLLRFLPLCLILVSLHFEWHSSINRLWLFGVDSILIRGFVVLLMLLLLGDMLRLLPLWFLNYWTLHGWCLNNFYYIRYLP